MGPAFFANDTDTDRSLSERFTDAIKQQIAQERDRLRQLESQPPQPVPAPLTPSAQPPPVYEGLSSSDKSLLRRVIEKALATAPSVAQPSNVAEGIAIFFKTGDRARALEWLRFGGLTKEQAEIGLLEVPRAIAMAGSSLTPSSTLTRPGPFRSPAAALAAGIAAVDAGSRKPPADVMQRLGLDFDEALQMIIVPPLPAAPEVEQRLRAYQRQLAASA